MRALLPVWALLLPLLLPPVDVVAQDTTLGPLLESQVYYTQGKGDNSTDNTVISPQVVLAGIELSVAEAAQTVDACAELCRGEDPCTWFVWCPAQGGCDAGGVQLEFQDCQLLAPNGTAVPQVLAQGLQVAATSGFPWRTEARQFPGFTTVPAQGFEGMGDQTCPGSVLPGKCAFRTAVEAAMFCMTAASQCRTIVVYPNGTDGASDLVAVLKAVNLPPSTTTASPLMYSITRLDNLPITAQYLYNSDGTTILPTPEEAAANSSWQGCFIGRNAAVDGIVVSTIAQPSAEACCRACRGWGLGSASVVTVNATSTPDSCNCWNYCEQPGGCRYQASGGMVLQLEQYQCQLRFQTLIQPTLAYPAALIAKGPAVPFSAGGPIVTSGPQLPGYTLLPGKGLFSFGRFNCSQSLRPEIQECVLPGSPQQLADICDQEWECEAFILKQQGVSGLGSSLGIFKHDANASAILWNPTGLLYLRDEQPAVPPSPSPSPPAPDSAAAASSLSAGAIAGIAVGSAAAAAALVGAAVWLARRRRQRRLHQQGAKLNGSGGSSSERVADEEAAPASGAAPAAAAAAPDAGPPPSAFAAAAFDTGGGSSSPAPQSLTSQPSVGVGELPHLPSMSSTVLGAGMPHAPSLALPELQQLIQAQDAAVTSSSGDSGGAASPSDAQQQLLAAAQLPQGLRDFLVDPDSFHYCRLPNGKLHELGSGASGKVYKAVLHGEFVAAKEIEIGTNPDLQQTFVREAVRLHQLRHATVVGFVGVALVGTKGVLLQELCEGRDLYGALSLLAAGSRQRLFGWQRLGRRVAFDVARALNYCHSKGVVHLDVKSSNVLLTASGAARLGDVGVAVISTRTFLSGLPALVGTYAWTAPEVLMGQQCTSAVDIFSFGVVLWEIVTGEQPARGRLRPPRVPQECPQEVADLITRCTSADPGQRPTAQQLMEQLGLLLRRGPRGGRTSIEESVAAADTVPEEG